MPIRFCTLASGSKGNAVYVANGRDALLVDCGLSGVELFRRLDSAGLSPGSIRAVLLSHEHNDHRSGVGVVSRKLGVPVLATAKTRDSARGLGRVRHQRIEAGDAFSLAGLTITPFAIPHDASDPVGFTFQAGGGRLGLCTDLGTTTRLVEARLKGCHALILEFNHDPEMLAQGPYPQWLKQRVRSRHGHISNQEGAGLLSNLHHRDLQQVVLAHLSETNNLPDLALGEAGAVLQELNSDAWLSAARQDRPSQVMEI